MAKYRYNGIELPALPEWDKVTYPYAYIIKGAWVDGRYSGGYVFVAYKKEANMSKTNDGALTFGYVSGSAYILYYLNADATGWETTGYSNATTYLIAVPIWANTDVYYDEKNGGALYLAASDPVPLLPEALPVSPYLPNNGAWVKHDIYKQVGNQWVKQPQGAVEVEGGAWSALS